jgi:uncharacterized protein (DUF779 family)
MQLGGRRRSSGWYASMDRWRSISQAVRCDGSLPRCLLANELGQGANDLRLGEIEGGRFYIDAEQHERCGEPEFLLDAVGGAPQGFSFGLPHAHFLTSSLSGEPCQLRAAQGRQHAQARQGSRQY